MTRVETPSRAGRIRTTSSTQIQCEVLAGDSAQGILPTNERSRGSRSCWLECSPAGLGLMSVPTHENDDAVITLEDMRDSIQTLEAEAHQ